MDLGARTERARHGLALRCLSSTAAVNTAETLEKMTRRYEETGSTFSRSLTHSRMCDGWNEPSGRVPRYGKACSLS